MQCPNPTENHFLSQLTPVRLQANIVAMAPTEVRIFCRVEPPAQSLLKAAMKQVYLSAHTFRRILQLVKTIADLVNSDIIKIHHLAEAIQYRPRRMVQESDWGDKTILLK